MVGACSSIDGVLEPTVFLLSPAKLSGRRGSLLLKEDSEFALAKQLRSVNGAPLAELFSFVSGLYFRGKVSYVREFTRSQGGLPGALVISAGGGLCLLDEPITLGRLRGWANVAIHEDNPHFTAPLLRQASELEQTRSANTRFVLLGSVATNKYIEPLLEIFGDRLLFPIDFLGRGDMSRGALLLRAARDKRELTYTTVADATQRGARGLKSLASD